MFVPPRRLLAGLLVLAHSLTALGLPVPQPGGTGSCGCGATALAGCSCPPAIGPAHAARCCRAPATTVPLRSAAADPSGCCSSRSADTTNGCPGCGSTGPACCCTGHNPTPTPERSVVEPERTIRTVLGWFAPGCRGKHISDGGLLTGEPVVPGPAPSPQTAAAPSGDQLPVLSAAAAARSDLPPVPPPKSV